MIKRPPILVLIIFGSFQANCQRTVEVGIKPTEFAYLNFETYVGVGSAKTRYGLFLSFRPSTQDSGIVKSGGSGMAGGYGYRCINWLYTSYTIGLYNKVYLGKALTTFLETDVFYRNWHFDKKPAEFHDAEKTSLDFNGVRTENVDVYGLKLLIGQTFLFKSKEQKGFKPYLEIYAGAGIRYQEETYQTFNGYVGDIFYTYKIDRFFHVWPTPQLGLKLGLLKKK